MLQTGERFFPALRSRHSKLSTRPLPLALPSTPNRLGSMSPETMHSGAPRRI